MLNVTRSVFLFLMMLVRLLLSPVQVQAPLLLYYLLSTLYNKSIQECEPQYDVTFTLFPSFGLRPFPPAYAHPTFQFRHVMLHCFHLWKPAGPDYWNCCWRLCNKTIELCALNLRDHHYHPHVINKPFFPKEYGCFVEILFQQLQIIKP